MTKKIDNLPYLSEIQVMEFLNYSDKSMSVLRKSKALTRYEIGNRYFYDRNEIIQLIESSKVQIQEKEEFEKYVQSLNKIEGLKDILKLEKKFVFDKTHLLLTNIALALSEIDANLKFISGRDWYVLLKVIENKGDVTELCKKFGYKRQSVLNIFHRNLRLLISMISNYKNSYLMIDSIKSENYSLKMQNKELGQAISEITLKYNNITDSKKINLQDIYDRSKRDLEILHKHINDLDISLRTYNCLKKYDIENLSDILRYYKRNDLMRLRNFGKKSLNEIEELLKDYGLI
jgi:hypothetical protein